MRFLIDAQLPPALARHLVAANHEALHVSDLGLERATDWDIWRHASDHGLVIVTKDEDFVALRTSRADGPPIVWMRIGNTTRDNLLRIIAKVLPGVVAALNNGEAIVEVAEI